MVFQELDTSKFKSLEKLRNDRKNKEVKMFPELSESMQKILKESYKCCYGGDYEKMVKR